MRRSSADPSAEVNAIFGKSLGVLGHADLFEPVRNLLHRGHQGGRGLDHGTESLHR
jgi:hypothetical protein